MTSTSRKCDTENSDISDFDSDSYEISDDDDEDYIQNENKKREYNTDSSDDDDFVDQSAREKSIFVPESWLLSKDKKIQYSKDDLPQNVRRSSSTFNNNNGPTAFAVSRCTNPLSAFLLFLEPIEKIILDMTNLYGVRQYKEKWEMIDIQTLRAYIGLLLLAGVYRSKGECLTELWDDKRGRPIFRATMSLEKFRHLNSCIRFDDKNDRFERRQRDKLAAIRNVFDKWNNNLKRMYVLGDCVTIDEQLIPFRGKTPFTQYIPSKPYKYGIKAWVLCDSHSYYAYNMQIYVGKDRNCTPEVNQGQRVVLELTKDLYGRNVTCDNFFTSYELANQLKKCKMTIVGTVRKNRKEIPPILLDMKKKPPFYSEFIFDRALRLTMVSYVPKKNRFVILLSTLHTKKEIHDDDDKKKPEIIHYYNKTKGAVDVLDERIGTYRCKRKVNRWPVAIFANIIDVSAFNSFVIFTELNPTWNKNAKKYRRRLFLIDVSESLVLPYIESRKNFPHSINAKKIVMEVQGKVDSINEPSGSGIVVKLPKTNKRARCYICTYKNNSNLYSNRCNKCKRYVCSVHHFNICDNCY